MDHKMRPKIDPKIDPKWHQNTDYREEIRRYAPQGEQERQDQKVILDCLRLFPQTVLLRSNELAHLTSSGFIVNETADRVLMVHHNIRGVWAWTGGHADGDGNLLEVALREAAEETGVAVRPLCRELASLDVLTVQGHVKNGRYVSGHLHLSAAYLLVADEGDTPRAKPDENSDVAWFDARQINGEAFSAHDVSLYAKLLRRAQAQVRARRT